MTDGDLKKIGSLSKANPHKKEWSSMRLYLDSQVRRISLGERVDSFMNKSSTNIVLDVCRLRSLHTRSMGALKVWRMQEHHC